MLLLLLLLSSAAALNPSSNCFSISNSELCPRFQNVLLTFPPEDPSLGTTFSPSDDALRSYLASWFHGVTESTNFDKKLQQLVDISTGTYYNELLGCHTPNVTVPAHARYETTVICRQLVQYFFCPDGSFDPDTFAPVCQRTCQSWAQSIISGLPPNPYNTQTGFYIPRTVESDGTANFSPDEATEEDFLRNQNNICLSPPDLTQWNSLVSRSYCSDRPYLNGSDGQCVNGDDNEVGGYFLCGYRDNKASCALCDVMFGNMTVDQSRYSLFPHSSEPCCAKYADICNTQASNRNDREFGKGGTYNTPISATNSLSSPVFYGAVFSSAGLFVFAGVALCIWRCRSKRGRSNKLETFYERRLVAGRPAKLRKPNKFWWGLKVGTDSAMEIDEQAKMRRGSQTGSETSHYARDGKTDRKSTEGSMPENKTGSFKVLGIQQMKLIPKRDSHQFDGDLKTDGDRTRRPSINVVSSDGEDSEVILVQPDICNNLPLTPSVHTKTADEIETFGGFVSPTYANLYKQQHPLTPPNRKSAMASRGSTLTVQTSPSTLQKPFVGHTPSSQSPISASPSPTDTAASTSPRTYSPSEALLSRKTTSYSYSRRVNHWNSPLETIIQKPKNSATVSSNPFATHLVDRPVATTKFLFPMQSEQSKYNNLSTASPTMGSPLPLSATYPTPSASIPITSPVPLTSTSGSSRIPYTAIYYYCPALSDEITLKVGDQLVVNQVYDDAWGYGTNVTTGFSGVFPLACCVVGHSPLKEKKNCLPLLQKESTPVNTQSEIGLASSSQPVGISPLSNPGYGHLMASRKSSLTRTGKEDGQNAK